MLTKRLFSYKHVSIKFHQSAREAIFTGIKSVSQTVSQTLGPKGRNIALEYELGPPKITKDGVTIAKHLEFANSWQDLGSKLLKFPANESNIYAGDGTTTSTLLAYYILKLGLRSLDRGHHPVLVKEGLVKAGEFVDKYLERNSLQITSEDELLAICKVACNNDKDLACMLVEGILSTGRDGAFLVEEGNALEDRIVVSDGLVLPRGFASENFGLTEIEYWVFRVKLENPLILIANHKLHELKEVLHVFEYAKKNGRSLLLAAEDIDHEVLRTLIINKEKAELSCVGINFPGESNFVFLEDLAHFSGATLLNAHTISESQPSDLGSCSRLNVDSIKSTFFNGKGDTKDRKDSLLAEFLSESDPTTQSVLKERLQRLSGKLAIYEIGLKGGKVAMGERRDRVIDSLNSIRSACKEGFLPGGGSSLLFASRALKSFRFNDERDVGVRILQESLKEPIHCIAKHSALGVSAIDQLWEMENEEMGIDAEKDEICNLVERGVIDSAGVVRQAVRAAVSVAQMLIGTSAVVVKSNRYQPTKLDKYKKDMF